MVSHRQPPKGHRSRIKCWWVPLELQSFGTKTNFQKKDDSISSTKSQSERKSPFGGISTAKFASTLGGIWDYVADPAILQTKEKLTYHDILQNDNTVHYSCKQRKPNQSRYGDVNHESTLLPEQVEIFEALQNMKKQLLFASCNRVISTSFILNKFYVNNSYLVKDFPKMVKMTRVAASSNQASISQSTDKNPVSEDHAEITSKVTGKDFSPLEENTLIDESSSDPSNKSIVNDEDALSKKAMKLEENKLQNSAPFNSSYSENSMERAKNAIIISKTPDSDLHLGYKIDLSSERTYGQSHGSTDLGYSIAESSVVSQFKDGDLYKIERCLDSTLYPQNIKRHLLLVQGKLQNVLADNRYALSGAMAGTLVSLCLHPIDTIKTIIQSNVGHSSSHVLRQIIAEKGFLGLYRGIASNIASSAPISAIYTFTYESVKGALLPHFPKEYHSTVHCLAGACSSIATSVIFTPSECIKQQMQVDLRYRNCWSALIGCLENGGVPALYTGWVAVLCRNIPHSIIKFYTYESLKQLLSPLSKPDGSLGTLQTLICGGIAGSTAALFTTPFDVVKTRLQTQAPGTIARYNGVLHALQEIAREEGFQGLYRGLTPRLAMYVSQGAIFFASYEFLKAVFASKAPRSVIKTISQGENDQPESSQTHNCIPERDIAHNSSVKFISDATKS